MDVTIRAAREDEFEAVGELTAGAYLDDGLLTYGAEDSYLAVLRDVRRRAEHGEILVAVAAASADVVGTATFVWDAGEFADIAQPGEGEFRMLAVRREGRGRGVGEALVRECLARARERGLHRMVLSSSPEMTTAHRLYGRLGFTRTPERDWEPIPGLALLTFALDLTDGDR
ncbi:GNAT family N-acetyltransferase [Streptomyces sp. JJ36]|uniref:GNAT family N-acetyltransferase n=1 Tax=Streptomyces sp. JJ36 TaxID=2736645 RepID=UPI001F2B4818|nr:GNAT family N-acetyltransferase [Streptomyces sp. JJ36]MCF6523441.1 GNAT family N-acetyltransferase [Streptomyces sp. JJ36]